MDRFIKSDFSKTLGHFINSSCSDITPLTLIYTLGLVAKLINILANI